MTRRGGLALAGVLAALAAAGRGMSNAGWYLKRGTYVGGKRGRSKYDPHQGKRECARRLRNRARGICQ